MTASEDLLERLRATECPAFGHRQATRAGGREGPAPVVLARGEGAWVEDVEGRRYLDLVAGFGALLLGHGHPTWRAAVHAQVDRLVQGLGDVYASDAKVELLGELAALHPQAGAKVLLAQSGGDAVTAALKTTMLASGRPGVVAFDGAYHGLGFAPLAACGYRASFRSPFAAQLADHVRFAPYPGVRGATAEASLSFVDGLLRDRSVGTVLVEPLLGRGGCVVPPPGFLASLSERCRFFGAHLVVDEIWTGLGRAGAWLRSVEDGAAPDVICLGKGLGGGLSVAACVASAEVMDGWTRHGEVVHTSTHVGAPLPCAAALATLRVLREEGLVEAARARGEQVRGTLRERLGEAVVEVRGAGAMIGIEVEDAATAQRASARLLRAGVLVLTGGVGGETLTLTPPLTMRDEEWDHAVDALVEALGP